VVAVNVTDLQSAVMRVGSLAVCAKLVERGLEPIYQLTCRDRNRLALQSDLLSAWALGIQNVLCLSGDHPSLGDHMDAKPVFDLDSVQLLKPSASLNKGKIWPIMTWKESRTSFPGAVVNPGSDGLEPQLIKMEKKIEAGARFFQTQAIYEPEKFEHFMNRVQKYQVPVMAGIVVLKSAGMAQIYECQCRRDLRPGKHDRRNRKNENREPQGKSRRNRRPNYPAGKTPLPGGSYYAPGMGRACAQDH
jgi:methylenetetrahydrofolate reductase (NADPH)